MKSLTTLEPSKTSTDTTATQWLDAWWTLGQAMKRNVSPILEREHNMDFGDFMILNTIERGANYPGLLCERCAVSPSGISRMLENLTKRDLVRRSLDTEDSRRVRLEITEKGHEVLNATRSTLIRLVEGRLSTLPEAQVTNFIQTLTQLANSIGEPAPTN